MTEDYEKLLKMLKKDIELAQTASYMHTYHMNLLGKEHDIKRCVVCLILNKEPVVNVKEPNGNK